MDDLIVIILTLIVAGVGVLGQLKKKKQNQTGSGVNKKASSSFWDLIQGEAGFAEQGVKSEFEEADFDNENDIDVQKRVPKQRPHYSFDGKKEGVSEIENDIKKTTRKSKIKSGVMNDFSLRKAVVYSEILNRKYT
jgi:hypothetical protein